jgi:hydrogenase maturation protease
VTNSRILIACVGNIFLGDDGFGVEVARRLAGRPLPPEVILKDFGIRGFDLTYTLLEPFKLVILVDACQRGGKAGDVYLIEPDPPGANVLGPLEAHAMNPMKVLQTVKSMGGAANRVLMVCCEPADLGSDEEGKLGLSEPAAAAVDVATDLIETLISKALVEESIEVALQSQ